MQQETEMNRLFDITQEPFNMLPVHYHWFVHELSKTIDCKMYCYCMWELNHQRIQTHKVECHPIENK